MIGVPGGGKSWVIRKVRTWVDIRFEGNEVPYDSSEYKTLHNCNTCEIFSHSVRDVVVNSYKGQYGKSVAAAFSGCGAGMVKGFTVHHAFLFPVNLNKRVTDGELPLSDLTESCRTKLLDGWSSVKLVTIDEVYTLKVELISLINDRLRQKFDSNIPFAGIPVIIAGDPRQIVPVNGKALYTVSKYFDELPTIKNTGRTPKLNKKGMTDLSEREEKGFRLYLSSKFFVPLTTTVRISPESFANLNMKIATYDLFNDDIQKLNQFWRPEESLYTYPWIYCPWLFPTWKEVNRHIQTVRMYALQNEGSFRAWAPVYADTNIPENQAKEAIKSFYKSDTNVTSKFTCLLPYIDFFQGQIVCLKKNWNPTWNLFNNAKAFVVAIKCDYENGQNNPLMPLKDAIKTSYYFPDHLKYPLIVKPLIPFLGPSAIPGTEGVLEIPWVKINRKINNCKLEIFGPNVFPANAFSHHQSQGSTFNRTVSCINEHCKAYGMANVVTSRTPIPECFAITNKITKQVLQPCPYTSKLVENEYHRLTQL